MSEKNPKPVAQGNFSKTPFSHILVYLWAQKKGGTLQIAQGDHKVSIYFREGTPAKVRSNVGGRDLKSILHKLGFISDDQLKACEEEFETNGGLQGQILVRQGAIDPPDLIRGLREQMLLKLTDVFAMTKANYEFYDKINMIVGFGPDELFPVDPYPVLMAGMRVHSHRQNIDAICKELKGKWIAAKDPDTIRRFRLNKTEKIVLEELLDSPQNYDDFVNSDHLNVNAVMYIIYVLMITKLIEITGQGPRVEEQPAQILPAKPSKLDSINPLPGVVSEDPLVIEKKQQILDKATLIPSQNYYEMLEVPYGAPHEDVRTAFFRMAKLYHPDKVSRVISDELKETLDYVFSNMSEAHATLIDPDAREEYESAIKGSVQRTSIAPQTNEESEVRRVLQAENHFQKALVFLKRGQLEKAKSLIDKAISNNPKEAEYRALWAHLEGRLRPLHEDVEDLVNALRQAIETHPKSERIHLYMAQILKRAGHDSESRLHFGKVVQMNPGNIEAARELRLMDLRNKTDEKRQSGFFKKFFN